VGNETLDAIKEVFGIVPACDGMERKEITSLLNSELIRCRLTRKNAHSYWAHEVEVYNEYKRMTTWVDFMQFEPGWHHTARYPGCVEKGTFTCYEVKSCIADIKSGHGINFYGDENFLVMPVEVYPKYKEELIGGKLDEYLPVHYNYNVLLYGKLRNGWRGFRAIEGGHIGDIPRTKPASELLLCMMRALIANSDRADVQHEITREAKP